MTRFFLYIILFFKFIFCDTTICDISNLHKCFSTSLKKLPEVESFFKVSPKKEITLPDLHGNALKLLNSLVKANILEMDSMAYDYFVKIYFKKSDEVCKKDLEDFDKILSKIFLTKAASNCLVRLIGDEFCDRGSNDLWTLLLIARLKQLGLKIEFIFSNHSFEFVAGVEKDNFLSIKILPAQAKSLLNLYHLISKGLVDYKEVKKLFNLYYKNSLKMISYTVSPRNNSIILYTHAPVGLKEIQDLAEYFKLEYLDSSLEKLRETVDKINEKFMYFVSTNSVHSIFDGIKQMLWNRNYKGLVRPHEYKGYKISFVHGHDAGEQSQGNVVNLDYNNNLGKTESYVDGDLQVFVI